MCMRICEVCGKDFKDKSKFKPTQYCSPECGEYNKFKDPSSEEQDWVADTRNAIQRLDQE